MLLTCEEKLYNRIRIFVTGQKTYKWLGCYLHSVKNLRKVAILSKVFYRFKEGGANAETRSALHLLLLQTTAQFCKDN